MNQLQNSLYDILVYFDRVCKKNDIKYTLAYGTLLGAIRHKGFIPWDDDIDVLMLRKDYNKLVSLDEDEFSVDYFLQTHDSDPEYFRPFAKIRSNKTQLVERNSSHLNINHGVWLDIFILDKVSNHEGNLKKQYLKGETFNDIIRKKIYMHASPRDRGIKRLIKWMIEKRNILLKKRQLKIANQAYVERDKIIRTYENSDFTNVFAFEYLSRFDQVKDQVFKENDFLDTTEYIFERHKFPIPKNYDEILTTYYGDYMELPPETERTGHQ